jgi:hypothetical protein
MTDVYRAAVPVPPGDERDKLSGSARGWHTIQMGVLGFIGLCGVLRTGGGSLPAWVQWLAGVLAVAALVLGAAAVYLVGRVAYPIDGPGVPDPAALARAIGRLRGGVRLTILALILIVIAALSGWWPKTADAGAATVTVADVGGRSWCGTLVAGAAGAISLDTASGTVTVPAERVAEVRPVEACPAG